MRKVTLIAVGKIKESYFADAISEYKKRLSRFCELNIIELADRDIKTESEAIIAKLGNFKGFLLDLGGEMVSSEDLADLIEGRDNLVFVIGGSLGVNQTVKDRAEKKLCFGKITYPHQLMRVITLEQIYRAFSILNNMPYHK